MVSVSAIKSIGRFFKKSSGEAAKVAESAKSTVPVGTRVVPGLDGEILESYKFGKLFRTESKTLADGSKQTVTSVYSGNGQYIGKGGDEGLDTFRTVTRTRESEASVLGGDIVTISKTYRDTMAHTRKNVDITKEYTPEGVMEHSVTKTQVGGNEPVTKIYDRTKSLTGETAYERAVRNQEQAELAAKAEQEAALRAEQEAAARLAATRPRVNTGKLFNKNIDEFNLMEEKTLANGTIVRRYAAKGNDGASQYIVTKDLGNYHEEYLVDMSKDMKIRYTRLGDANPSISMEKGLQYRQTYRPEKDPVYGREIMTDRQIYDDGFNHVELQGGYAGRFKVNGIGGHGSVNPHNLYRGWQEYERAAQSRLNEIVKDAKANYVDLESLWKPYQA